jgi:20S proteasome alpha/beta subunit
MLTPRLRTLLTVVNLIYIFPCSTNANNNYNAYQYDMAVPQFTPDGRLLQVEYASAAADHSTPIISAAISDELVLICTTRRCRKHDDGGIFQERLVLVPTGRMVSSTTCAPSTAHDVVVVALSGVLADSLSLLEAVQEERFSHQLMYGFDGSPARVARTIADLCQQHAFGGGLRPFGATLLVCGTTEPRLSQPSTAENPEMTRSISMYRTDPSGGILETPYESLIRDGDSPSCCVVVGGGSVARILERRISSYYAEAARENQARIGDILSLVLQEQNRVEGGEDDNSSPDTTGLTLEAVLVSNKKGVIKLSGAQIESFMRQGRQRM